MLFKKKLGKRSLPLFISTVIIINVCNASYAGYREEEIKSTNLAGTPYLTVRKDERGSSSITEEGVYVRSEEDGNWKIALSGNIRNTKVGPLIDELSVTKISKRFESLVVLNQRLTLFSNLSVDKDEQTFLKFGEGRAKVYDPVTQRELALPLIKNPDSVNVYQLPVAIGDEFQTVLISIKDEKSDDEKEGFTFAFNLKVEDSGSSEMNIVSGPILLDYSYMSAKELSNLILSARSAKRPLGIVSPLLVNVMANSPERQFPALKGLLDELKDQLKLGNFKREKSPYYTIDKFEVSYPEEESRIIAQSGALILRENFSLDLRRQRYVSIGDISKTIPGEIDVYSTGEPVAFTEFNNDSFIFFKMNGSIYFAGALMKDIVEVPANNFNLLKDTTFVVLPGMSEDQSEELLRVLVSTRNESKISEDGTVVEEDQGRSYYFTFSKKNSGGVWSPKAMKHLSDTYYNGITLKTRVKELNGKYYFDHLTPRSDDLEEYFELYNEKLPHFQLKDSSLEVGHIKASKTFQLIGDIEYREYITEEGEVAQGLSGIFERGPKGDQFIENVKPIGVSGGERFFWSEDSFKSSNNEVLNVKTFFANQSFDSEGENSLGVIVSNERKGQNYIGLFNEIPSVSDIKKVFVFPSSKHHYYVLIQLKSGSIYEYKFSSDFGSKKQVTFERHVGDLYSGRVLEEKEVYERIVYDQEGNIFWVETPELSFDDESYYVRSLLDYDFRYPTEQSDVYNYMSYDDYIEKHGEKKKIKGEESYAWKIRPNVYAKTRLYKNLDASNSGTIKTDLFPDLVKLLEKLSSFSEDPKHVALIIPDELKEYIDDMILTQWIVGAGNTKFTRRNQQLSLYHYGETSITSQDKLLKQMRIPDDVKSSSRALMIAKASMILQSGRLESDGQGLENKFMVEKDSRNEDVNLFESTDKQMVPAHSLYLLANEGKRISLADYSSGKKTKKTYSQLILASESEWASLQANSELEGSYGLDKHYEEVHLGAPGVDEQVELFVDLFGSKKLEDLGIGFDSGSRNSSEISREANILKLAKYIVGRIENLSRDQKKNPLIAFSDVLVKLRWSLQNDMQIRREKVVNRGVVEQNLAKVFSLPLRLKDLPANDPLNQLNRRDILTRIQNEGKYPGPFDVTQKVVDTILGQTRQGTALAIPSSIILDGASGTGKTQLTYALTKTLGLKTYDMKLPLNHKDNSDAQVFFLRVSKLTDSEKGAGLMNVDTALGRLDDFLTLPFGHRGFLIFDDIHLSNNEVRKKLISRIRTLLDSDEGVVTVKKGLPETGNEEHITFPSRNLTVILTYNPAESDGNAQNTYLGTTPESRGVKALGGSSIVDASFFKRFSTYMIMDQFSTEAKGPGLIEKFSIQMKDFFQNGYFVTVSRGAIEKVVKAYSKEDARKFFSGAINGLSEKAEEGIDLGSKDGFKIIIAKDKSPKQNSDKETEKPQSMIDFVDQEFLIVDVNEKNPEGMYEFAKLMVNTFRVQIYEAFVQSLFMDSAFAGSESAENNLQSYLLQAIYDHIKDSPELTVADLALDRRTLGVSGNLSMVESSEARKKELASFFEDQVSGDSLYGELTGEKTTGSDYTRKNVNFNFKKSVNEILEIALKEKLQVQDLDALPNADEWAEFLMNQHEASDDEELSVAKQMDPVVLGKKLAAEFKKYAVELESSSLVEKQDASLNYTMGNYDKMRTYLNVMDRALVDLPWSSMTGFLAESIEDLVESELSGRNAVQDFLFGKGSLFHPQTTDYLVQVVKNAKSRQGLKEETVNSSRGSYSKCLDILTKGGQ